MSRSRQILSLLIEADDSHHGLWDQLNTDPDAQIEQYLDLIADIYNGGIQQCIEHERGFDQFIAAANTLRSRGGQASQNLAGVLRGLRSSYEQAAETYQQTLQSARQGEGYDEDFDPFAEFAEQWDEAENFIYNAENMDAVHRELLQNRQGQATMRARDQASALISQQTA